MRTQATRFDLIEAIAQRRKDRRDMLILAPLALFSMCTIAATFAGFFTW